MLTLAVFHEVRVPLNTALLAVQNLEGELVFKGLHDDQEEMVHGLIGSLTMMEKVSWKIALGFPSDNGRSSTMCCHSTGWSLGKVGSTPGRPIPANVDQFAQARKQFDFHKSIQLVGLSHRMQALMAGIDLIVSLDPDIDKIGGSFVGDEMRLRQVAR